MPETSQGATYARTEAILRWPMMALTVLFLVALVAPLDPHVHARTVRVAWIVEQAVWTAFLAEYLVLLALARDRKLYLRTHILEAVIVVVPAFRLFRLARLLRLASVLSLLRVPSMLAAGLRGVSVANRAFHKFRLGYILVVMLVVLLVASGLMLYVERSANPALGSYFKCLWWGVVTMTTVGYGDAAPVTATGRAVAMVFMLIGIGLAGVVTATVASIFVGIERRDEDLEMHQRFDRVEAQLAEVGLQLALLTDLQTKLPADDGESTQETPK